MHTKQLCILIHIGIKGEVGTVNTFKPSSNFLTDSFKALFLLWILYVICVLSLSYCLVCLLQPCCHLLGKGEPLGSLVCDVFLYFCHFPIRCSGSGLVLDCIVFLILAFFLILKDILVFARTL